MRKPTILPSSEVWHRDDLAILCNWRRLWRVAEVGVDRGEFAQTFLSRWIGDEYWGVDDYQPYAEMPYPRDADYQMAVHRLAPHASRAKLLPMGSAEAALLFAPGALDFVYIDGCHEHAAVCADLLAWWPAVSAHGIISGHDFDETHPGVQRAVSEFAAARGLTVYLTAVEGYGQEECPSWYIYKGGMPGAGWRRC